MHHPSSPAATVGAARQAFLEPARAAIRRRWGRYARRWIRGQVVLVWSLAQALPDDVLDRAPLLRNLCDPVLAAIPSAASFAARSAFPQVAELVLCLGWVLALLNLCFGILLPEHLHERKPKTVFGDLADLQPEDTGFGAFMAAGLFLLVVIPVLMWAYLAVPVFDTVDEDMVFWSFTHRMTFGFVAQVASSFIGIFAAVWLVVAGHFVGFLVSFWSR